MTKSQAIQALSAISAGTIAHIIKSAKYEHIDNAVNTWIIRAANADPQMFENCESWMDVLHALKITQKEGNWN